MRPQRILSFCSLDSSDYTCRILATVRQALLHFFFFFLRIMRRKLPSTRKGELLDNSTEKLNQESEMGFNSL